MRRTRLWVVALLLVVMTAAVWGQSFKATLVGVVSDVQRDAIPGASVTLERADTGERLSAISDAEGRYSFQQVTPGVYVLRCEAKGFAAHTEQNLTLEVSQTRRYNFLLRAGGIAETVTVTASEITINTEVGAKTEVMTTRQIEDLPLNGRNYLDLAKLLPGVQESPEDAGKLNTNGTRSDATGYIQDGISNRIDRGAGQAVVTSPDTIQ
ncbi:MAG: carboxypeptidase regulatory-like domain-containing protein, partial [Acidobacteria bacterium]|nr:carboxypeptidase regulatory-like domain-containing protein [Acidobacteriota bacterium]